VKKELLDELNSKSRPIPFFLRLRDYEKGSSIEELLASHLKNYRIHDVELWVREFLREATPLCVLDGLDEVRPQILTDAYEAITRFYKTFFVSASPGRLIVTCRKEAYRSVPLPISDIWEVRPLDDDQIQSFAKNWPLGYPEGRNAIEFWNDLSASEKILEVSRSPLLLVGTLLLYSESGLGIPGHRLKYLDKIKRTLIEEWATKQGQPPDPLRDAYTPVLSTIALEMHNRNITELERRDCLALLPSILPQYGIEATRSEDFLNSLITRTGILVRDAIRTHLIFVQFTLQEYFASLRLAAHQPEQLAALEPIGWWREAILLSIAQQSDPTAFAKALFKTSPLVGALAVAEAPTPSLSLQGEAIAISLEQLDAGKGESAPALVALARKVAGGLATKLCDALEARLENVNETLAASAGRILATAGTDAATDVLSRHPKSWAGLVSVSTLSSNFDKHLAEWVATPDHSNWGEAAELLVRARGVHRIDTITSMLDGLPSERASQLAFVTLRLLCEHERDSEKGDYYFLRLPEICHSLRFATDYENLFGYLSEIKGPSRWERGPGLIMAATALFYSSRRHDKDCERSAYRQISDSIVFSRHGRRFVLMAASGILLLSFALSPRISSIYMTAIIAAACLCFSEGFVLAVPWYGSSGLNAVWFRTILFMVISAALSLALFGGAVSLLDIASTNVLWGLVCALFIVVLACVPYQETFRHDVYSPRTADEKLLIVFGLIAVVWFVALTVLSIWTFIKGVPVSLRLLGVLSITIVLWSIYCFIRTFVRWRVLAVAASRAKSLEIMVGARSVGRFAPHRHEG